MISPTDIIPLLIQSYPGLRQELIWDVEDWLKEDGTVSACMVFASASHLVAAKFNVGRFENADALFALIEKMVDEGSDEVQVGATTCFLENLMNRESTAELFVHLLGPKSRAFCRAWNDSCGVKTPGLYDVEGKS